VGKLADVPVGRDKQMTGGVRKAIEEREGVLAAMHDEGVPVVELLRCLCAEDAPILAPGSLDVVETPGRPQRLGNACAAVRPWGPRAASASRRGRRLFPGGSRTSRSPRLSPSSRRLSAAPRRGCPAPPHAARPRTVAPSPRRYRDAEPPQQT